MTQEPAPWLFLPTITHLCQELLPCINLEFSLGFILTNSSRGKWFTASAEAASEEEISVRAVLWWVPHADFPAHLPAWRTDSPLVCSAKPNFLQSHCSDAKVVYKSWDSAAIVGAFKTCWVCLYGSWPWLFRGVQVCVFLLHYWWPHLLDMTFNFTSFVHSQPWLTLTPFLGSTFTQPMAQDLLCPCLLCTSPGFGLPWNLPALKSKIVEDAVL